MFKELVVNRAFDTVEIISRGTDRLFSVFVGDSRDGVAVLTAATCCFVIAGCRIAFDGRKGATRRAFLCLCPLLLLVAMEAAFLRIGASATRIAPEKIKKGSAKAYRVLVGERGRKAGSARLCRMDGASPLEELLRLSPGMAKVSPPSLRDVKSRGVPGHQGGWYCLVDGAMWFNTVNGEDPRAAGKAYGVVYQARWLTMVRRLIEAGYVLAGFGICVRLFCDDVLLFFQRLSRQRGFLFICAAAFLILGGHQLRFLHQDARMQMVTSRDDDGYFFERLMRAHDLKTMDPLSVGNHAYGAIGYFPFASLSFVTGRLGLPLSVEALNVFVRGMKVLLSLGMLATVWWLAERHFSRRAAFFATALVLTNYGFLQYTSYPFYPDVMMSAAAILAVSQMLSLARRWSDRTFFLIVFFSALSVSIKFITFPLFMLFFVVAVISTWKKTGKSLRNATQFLASRLAMAGVLSVAVYFLCNPYLKYNFLSVVPNWKEFYGYYSVETPYLVAGSAAKLRDWVLGCYVKAPDFAEAILALLALAAIPLSMFALMPGKKRGIPGKEGNSRWLEGLRGKCVIMLIYVVITQAYLCSSVTLPDSIDGRLVLSLLPLIYILAFVALALQWQFFVGGVRERSCVAGMAQCSDPREDNAAPGKSRFRLPRPFWLVTLCVLSAIAISVPRLLNLSSFLSEFGRPPRAFSVAGFLKEAGATKNQTILASLQAYVPAQFENVIDGQWQPDVLENRMFRQSGLPAMYVEDESYYDSFFSPSAGQHPFNTPQQEALYKAGRVFYDQLRAGRLIPFALVHAGEEVTGTNDIVKGGGSKVKVRIYANRFAFSENLVRMAKLEGVSANSSSEGAGKVPRDAETTPFPNLGSHFKYVWDSPTTLSLIHLSSFTPMQSARIQLTLLKADGLQEARPFESSITSAKGVTEHFVELAPPLDARSIEVVVSDDMRGLRRAAGAPGATGEAAIFKAVEAIAPGMPGINPAASFFSISGVRGISTETPKLASLLSRRPAEAIKLVLAAGQRVSVDLRATQRPVLRSVQLILEGAEMLPVKAECNITFEGGVSVLLPAAVSANINPPQTIFAFRSDDLQKVETCELLLTNLTSSEIHLRPRQIAFEVMK